MKIAANMTELVGGTPIVGLQRMGRELGAEIAIKLEFFNPLSSVKDRIAKSMIDAAEAGGALRQGMTVLEAPGTRVTLNGNRRESFEFGGGI